MPWLFILIGWIVGIAQMGKNLPHEWIDFTPIFCILTLVLSIILIVKTRINKNNIEVKRHPKKSELKYSFLKNQQFFILKFLLSILLSVSSFLLGHLYSENELNQRLKLRVTDVGEKTAVVYINSIDQLTQDGEGGNRIKQKAQVLDHHKAMNWVLYLKDGESTETFQLGHYYYVQGKAKPAHGYAVDGAFDQERWFLQENVMSSLQVQKIRLLSEQEVLTLGNGKFVQEQNRMTAKFRLYIEKKRLSFRAFIQQQPLVNKGLLLALLTGDESLLSSETQMLFKRLGISHLLAISGPHVLIFAIIFCFFICQMIQRFYPQIYLKIPRPYFVLIPFVSCVWLYTAFVGFEIPAMRTLLTVSLISALLILRQAIQALNLLLLSASLLLLIDPFSILSAAFWLSYGACFILIRVYQTLQQKSDQLIPNWKDRVYLFLKILIESQWKIFLALFPLVIFIFQQVSWISPLSNLIAIPLIGAIIVPLEVIGACLSLWITPLGLLFFHLADWVLAFLLFFLNYLDQSFGATLFWMAMTPWALLSLTLAVIIIFLPRGVVPKAWALICILPLLIAPKTKTEFQLNVLDVGQGQALFLNLPNQKIMIDMGGYYDESKFSIGEQVVIPYLMKQGVTQLDEVILSHLDQDHSGAFSRIQNEIKIKNVYSNQKDKRFDNTHFNYCYAGKKWQFDQIKIEILSPSRDSLNDVRDNQNELSCVVYIQVPQSKGYQNFLIMGDAGWLTEYQLLQAYPHLKVDVLVLGHHGSQHSSSFDFLKTLQPKLAIASAGFNNRYRHPHPLVEARLKALSIPFESTIRQGSIQFNLDADGHMQVQRYRQTRKWLQTNP